MSAVQLQKERHPLVNLALFITIPVLAGLALYFGIPGTGFNGLRPGVFFYMDVDLPEEARFMDNKIVCKSDDALAAVRAALLKVKPDYPVELVDVRLANYPSGYKFNVHYVSYYAQKFDLFGKGRPFRKGAEVGDPVLDAEVKAKDDELEQAIRGALEAYFRSKGAQ